MCDPDDSVLHLDLASNNEAPAAARRFVTAHAHALPPHLVQDAELLVSELVTNAVLHGRPAISLTLSIAPTMIGFAVSDAGDVFAPPGVDPAGGDSHGRGLRIVAAVAQEHGITSTLPPPGKTVWFQLSISDYR